MIVKWIIPIIVGIKRNSITYISRMHPFKSNICKFVRLIYSIAKRHSDENWMNSMFSTIQKKRLMHHDFVVIFLLPSIYSYIHLVKFMNIEYFVASYRHYTNAIVTLYVPRSILFFAYFYKILQKSVN